MIQSLIIPWSASSLEEYGVDIDKLQDQEGGVCKLCTLDKNAKLLFEVVSRD